MESSDIIIPEIYPLGHAGATCNVGANIGWQTFSVEGYIVNI